MAEVKTLSEILAERDAAEGEREIEFFDDPVPASEGRVTFFGIMLRQLLIAAAIGGGLVLAKLFLPDLFSTLADFLRYNISGGI